jgi:hypothetical protein
MLRKLHNALLHLPVTRMAVLSCFQAPLRLEIAKLLSSQRHGIACPRSIRTITLGLALPDSVLARADEVIE